MLLQKKQIKPVINSHCLLCEQTGKSFCLLANTKPHLCSVMAADRPLLVGPACVSVHSLHPFGTTGWWCSCLSDTELHFQRRKTTSRRWIMCSKWKLHLLQDIRLENLLRLWVSCLQKSARLPSTPVFSVAFYWERSTSNAFPIYGHWAQEAGNGYFTILSLPVHANCSYN